MADLLAAGKEVPTGPQVRVSDIGTGANAIYPLIGVAEYGWSFVATDIDADALRSARAILTGRPRSPIASNCVCNGHATSACSMIKPQENLPSYPVQSALLPQHEGSNGEHPAQGEQPHGPARPRIARPTLRGQGW